MNHRQVALAVLCLLGAVSTVQAQIAGPPFVFSNGTTIEASEVNTNFATLYTNALNRTGGTMTGALLFSADNNHDIGASGTTRPRDLFLARNATISGTLTQTGAAAFGGAVTFSSTAAANGVFTVTTTTAPQFLVRYDTSNRLALSIGSTGAVTLDAVGAGQSFAFSDDITAMESCDVCVLVLPCGRSAHTEAGWFAGRGRRVLAYIPERQEPELMYKLFDGICCTMTELVKTLEE
jgi:hypothetical protein